MVQIFNLSNRILMKVDHLELQIVLETFNLGGLELITLHELTCILFVPFNFLAKSRRGLLCCLRLCDQLLLSFSCFFLVLVARASVLLVCGAVGGTAFGAVAWRSAQLEGAHACVPVGLVGW